MNHDDYRQQRVRAIAETTNRFLRMVELASNITSKEIRNVNEEADVLKLVDEAYRDLIHVLGFSSMSVGLYRRNQEEEERAQQYQAVQLARQFFLDKPDWKAYNDWLLEQK